MTRFEQIASAFPLHAQRIAELANAHGGAEYFEWWRNDTTSQSAGRVLRGAFTWDATPEGHDYWRALYCGALA